MRKPIFRIILILIILSLITVTPSMADQLDDAIEKQRQIEQSKKQAEAKLKGLEIIEENKKKTLKEIQTQVVVAQTNLTKAEDSLNQAETAVTASEKELEIKQQELTERREVLQKRVRSIYEEGSLSYLDILFQSADLGDLISRMEYFRILVENDQNLLKDVKEKKQLVEVKTQELREKRDAAVQLQQESAEAKSVFDEKKRAEQKSLAEIKASQDELFTQIDKLEADSKALEQTIRNLQAGNKTGVVGTIKVWPLPGYRNISSDFGWRTHPITGKKSLHTGVDIPAPAWTKILAAGDGTVIFAGWNGAYGNAVIVDHGKGLSSMYPHQIKMAVKKGDIVKAGQVVGYVGSTGWSTGPHTHFEVRKNGTPVNPLDFF